MKRFIVVCAVVATWLGQRLQYRVATINGEPGLLRYLDGRLESAQAMVTDGERIVSIYVVRNPDKLAHLAPSLQSTQQPYTRTSS